MKFLLEWHPLISVMFLCVITLALSYIAHKAMRKYFSDDVLKENHEVGGFIFNAFGLIYAVLVAFVVFATWTEYDEAKKTVDMEASELADLFNNSKAFPVTMQAEINSAIIAYADNVINEEWGMLSEGKMSEDARKNYHRLWDVFVKQETGSINNIPVYQESLRHLNDLGEWRRSRIFESRNNIPGIIWGVLLFGGVMTVVYTFFFRTRKLAAQLLMSSGLTVLNTVILYMIYILDHPYVGYTRVGYESLEYVLTLVRTGGL
jgi:hypothetical protein